MDGRSDDQIVETARWRKIDGAEGQLIGKTGEGGSVRKTDINSYRDLDVYQTAFRLQQLVFELSKNWPREETYALTDQVRRSSRSIGANIAEGWAKRRYEAHFLSKLTDADGELQETRHWIDTAVACHYLTGAEAVSLSGEYDNVGRMIGSMIARYQSFCLR
jgi:four helix bundle protein